MIKGIIWDLDGTLVNLCEAHRAALNEALIFAGWDAISLLDHETRLNGLPTKKKLEILDFSQDDINIVNELKQKYTVLKINNLVKPDRSITETLQYCKSIGLKMAIATNSVRATVDKVMEKMKIGEFIDYSLSNEDVPPGESKPNPLMYLRAAELLELNPSQLLGVEDNINGQRAVLAAGLHLWKVKSPADITKDNIIEQLKIYES